MRNKGTFWSGAENNAPIFHDFLSIRLVGWISNFFFLLSHELPFYKMAFHPHKKKSQKVFLKLILFWGDSSLLTNEHLSSLHCQGLFCRSGHHDLNKTHSCLFEALHSSSPQGLHEPHNNPLSPFWHVLAERDPTWVGDVHASYTLCEGLCFGKDAWEAGESHIEGDKNGGTSQRSHFTKHNWLFTSSTEVVSPAHDVFLFRTSQSSQGLWLLNNRLTYSKKLFTQTCPWNG